ncbi:MAG: hypothetical protein L3K26_10940 [Candidatus Hydrogenedentes bacterium]|nr:hypothetical protein [Candidatus Hydrogenedentota bacterium]
MSNRRTHLRIVALALIVFAIAGFTVRADPIRAEDFDGKSVTLSGEGWKVSKHLVKDNRGNESCFVRVEAGGTTVHDLAASPNTGWELEDQDWTRLHIFRTPMDRPNMLAILWFSGGAHGPVNLRVVELEGDFPVIFDSKGTNFDYLEDLDGDGMPEAIFRSLAFDYFFRSAVGFSHADSPFPLLVGTYDPSRRRYAWANHLFPDVLAQKATASEKRFLEHWPEEDKIPVGIAIDQQSKGASAYRALMCWAVDACYAKGQAAADAIIDAHTDPILAVFAKHALIMTLRNDANYSFMKNNPVTR